jgi:AraC-like DNA-binding protein
MHPVNNSNLEPLFNALGISELYRLESNIKNIDINIFKLFNFAPDIRLLVRSYVVKKDFTNKIGSVTTIDDGILFSFHNIFDDESEQNTAIAKKPIDETPYIQIIPLNFSQEITFHKHTHMKHITIIVSKKYLQDFLKNDSGNFQYLFNNNENFLIEELMSDEMLKTAIEIIKADIPATLENYFYKLKALELLFHLFRSLEKRDTSTCENLRVSEITTVYKVRDKLISSLDQPISIPELKQFAGMNELKLRTIFKQIFGMGIYEYFQHFRMKESARLLTEERLSVSEVGYQMGFSNLSHFSRVFEKHIGLKPKKYTATKS